MPPEVVLMVVGAFLIGLLGSALIVWFLVVFFT